MSSNSLHREAAGLDRSKPESDQSGASCGNHKHYHRLAQQEMGSRDRMVTETADVSNGRSEVWTVPGRPFCYTRVQALAGGLFKRAADQHSSSWCTSEPVAKGSSVHLSSSSIDPLGPLKYEVCRGGHYPNHAKMVMPRPWFPQLLHLSVEPHWILPSRRISFCRINCPSATTSITPNSMAVEKDMLTRLGYSEKVMRNPSSFLQERYMNPISAASLDGKRPEIW